MELVETEIILIFDADYIPGAGLIRQLTAPFFDPEVGGVMGRVVPLNSGHNLLTRLLDLERSGGYQVDQQARMNLRLVPQHGGTVAGVRRSALREIGGWNDTSLTEDTDLTYRLLLHGWKTVYQNRSECYEEVPETWTVRIKQIMRWAKGHNQAMVTYALHLLLGKHRATLRERIDGTLLLGVYIMAPVTLVGWMLALAVFYRGIAPLARHHRAAFPHRICGHRQSGRILRNRRGRAARWKPQSHLPAAVSDSGICGEHLLRLARRGLARPSTPSPARNFIGIRRNAFERPSHECDSSRPRPYF